MKYSETAMRECFYLSNISPQAPKFNRGIWKKLEEKVRDWASQTNQIFIVTGPILNNRLVNKIGREHQITVPEYFFKAVVDTNKMGNGIAFVMKNQGSQLPLKSFVITIDSLERLTGRNFYSQIPQKKQDKIEKTVHFEHWDLND
jgi:endonuclease G